MKLYSYFRSSAAYRVRIFLNLKQVEYKIEPVNLVKAQQRSPSYSEINPQKLVPSLELDDGRVIQQSLAICEWLETNYSSPRLIPQDAYLAAQVRAFALAIACDIHPVNNLRILNYLGSELGADADVKNDWYRHWIEEGFAALEQLLPGGSDYCFGDKPGLADVFLIPQVFNAQRFNVDLLPYPKISAINDLCAQHPAFIDAAPGNQLDNPDVL